MKRNYLNYLYYFCIVIFAVIFVLILILRINFSDYHKNLAFKYADEYNLSRPLVLAVIKVESNFDEKAKSSKNAKGLMQLTDSTFSYISGLEGFSDLEIENAEDNVKMGCAYLKYLFEKFENADTVLCAYNAGEGNVSAWLKDKKYSVDGKTLSSVPFKETALYLKKIKLFEKYYRGYK